MNNQHTRRGLTQKPIKNNSVNIPELVSGSCRSMKKEEALNKSSFRAPLRSGFTLIELLVVVLIIGILAAVALPQYQKAVEKSRMASVLLVLKAIDSAQRLYFMEHGNYATNFSSLNIGMPGKWISSSTRIINDQSCWLYAEGPSVSCASGKWRLEKYYTVAYLMCWHYGEETVKQACKDLGATSCPPAYEFCPIPM